MAARITSATGSKSVSVRTPTALAQIAKNFTPVVLQANNVPVPPSNADYFSRMNLPTNISLDSGTYDHFDVQSDTRFIQNYILYHVNILYPEMNIKGHPYVTPLSIAGYCFHLFYAHLLACDKTFRPTMSWQASRFLADPQRKDLYEQLLSAHVPTFLSDLLLELSPVYDPRRTNVLCLPTLAGYSHAHDFGRTLPPSMYYLSHHLLASVRTNRDPDDVLDDFMAIDLISHNAINYSPSNYLGTWYASGHHDNFVNREFLAFFNPIVGRALSARPTFARLNFALEPLSQSPDETIYHALLLASDQNLPLTNTLIDALSSFILTDNASSPQLGSVLASLSGTLLLSHSIEPPTLPTWTAAKYTQNASPASVTDKKFCEDHKFLTEPTVGTDDAPYPADDTGMDTGLYHVQSGAIFDPATRPVKHVLFNGKLTVAPDVLYFQPYDVSPSSLGLTIAAGIKIELGEISGFMVPTEQPEASLDDNNGFTRISSIALSTIKPMFNDPTAANNAFRVIAREPIDNTSQPIMLALRTIAKSVFPRMAEHLLPAALLRSPAEAGQTDETNHYNMWTGFNVKAGTEGKIATKGQNFYLWSSYRIVKKYKAPEAKDILMVASFRPIYGTNVTLSRSKNPSLLIPN
jgi:hypothetical protein